MSRGIIHICFGIVYLFFQIELQASEFSNTTIESKSSPSVLRVDVNEYRYEAIDLSKSLITNTDYNSCSFVDVNFESTRIQNSTLQKCDIRNREYVHNLKLSDLLIVESEIQELSIANGVLNEVTFVDCDVKNLEISKSTLTKVTFRNCRIENLKIFRSNGEDFEIIGGYVGELLIENSQLTILDISRINFGSVFIKGGEIRRLKLKELIGSNSKLIMSECLISNQPYFSADIFPFLDLSRVLFPKEGFMIDQEVEGDKRKLRKHKNALYREARGIYTLLSQHFAEAKIDQYKAIVDYRTRLVERKMLESSLAQAIDFVWSDQLRGHYGSDPIIVLRSAIWIWLIFSFLYFFLGIIHLCWGMELVVNSLGERFSSTEPKFILFKERKSIFSYYITCLTFSFDQLISLGFRAFEISAFGRSFRQIPKIYLPIGIGKNVAVLQNIIGLVLLFNFIQAFLRTL